MAAIRPRTVEDVAALPALAEGEAVATLRRLVATPSQNGVDVDGELAVAREVQRILADTDCETELVPLPDGAPDRVSVGVRLSGSPSRPTLVMNGHLDTVPVFDRSQWSVDPFAGAVHDGMVWGRGAVDMKGGLAAQLLCARALSTLPARSRGSLVLHFAADEEKGGAGTRSLLDAGYSGDYGIVTEPTMLAISRAMRGMAAYRVTIVGRTAHCANPEEGLNPLAALPQLLTALDRYDARIQREVVHPLFPATRCTPTMVHSGTEQSSVPDVCEVTLDRRLIPGERCATVLPELERLMRDVAASADPGLGWSIEPLLEFAPCEVDERHELVRTLAEATSELRGASAQVNASAFASDVTELVHYGGIDAVQFGPGDIALAHAADERTAIRDVRDAAVILTTVALRILEGEQ